MEKYYSEIVVMILMVIAFSLPNNDLPVKKKPTNWFDDENDI